MSTSREVFVFISLDNKDHLVGRLWCYANKGKEGASFEYDESWLQNTEKFALEPAMALIGGMHHTLADQKMFGALGDSAPDRLGQDAYASFRNEESERGKKSTKNFV